MLSKQFNMDRIKLKPDLPFRWEHKWLSAHKTWMWVRVYENERMPKRPWRVRATSKKHAGGKTAILREGV